MLPISAMDALSAAISRWKRLLFTDFRFGRLLKLGFITLLAELSGGGTSGGNNFSGRNSAFDKLPHLSHAFRAEMFLFFVIGALIFFVIGIVIFYLSCRAKFAEFYIAASGDTRVGPPWRAFGRQTWRLFWTTFVLHLIALFVLASVALPIVLMMKHHGVFAGQISLRQMLAMFLLLLPLFFAWILAVQFAQMIIRDFMLPSWAMQDASVGQSWQIARAVIESDGKAFAGYTLVKVGMHIGIGIASILAFVAAMLVSAIPLVGIGMAIFLPLQHAGTQGKVLMVLLLAALAVLAFAWILLLVCAIIGSAQLIFQCYAVEWFAARYPPLAALMYPPPPAPPGEIPPPPPPEIPPMSAYPAT